MYIIFFDKYLLIDKCFDTITRYKEKKLKKSYCYSLVNLNVFKELQTL